MPSSTHPPTHYEILALPSTPSVLNSLTPQDIRLAYRRALLLHHPDKAHPSPSPSKPTIDAILDAYKTLIDPTTRAEYDRSLLLHNTSSSSSTTSALKAPSHPGLETVDLSDMRYSDAEQMWYLGCRCGREGTYVVTEEELELNAEYGETITPCQGCSLWLRVTFAVVAEDEG